MLVRKKTYNIKFAILHTCCKDLELFALADHSSFEVTQPNRGQDNLHPVLQVSDLDGHFIGGDVQVSIIVEKEHVI